MELIILTIKDHLSPETLNICDEKAFMEYGCLGKHDYSMEEEEVDRLLGKEAFCGGDLKTEFIEKLESHMEQTEGQSYFWAKESESQVKAFEDYLTTLNLKFDSDMTEDQDWNTTWRKHFKSIEISSDFNVIPSWEKKEDCQKDLFIYPGMGFGTGNHETTFLCLKIYESLKGPFKNVLDFGCGSGILGIAPMKHFNSHVTFVDIDTAALDNCVMNLTLNNHESYECEKDVVLRERYKSPGPVYDLIFANILKPVLMSEKDLLVDSLEEGGHLIVSGLLREQCDDIIDAYSILTHVESVHKGDWSAIIFSK